MKDERDAYFGKLLAFWIDFAVVGAEFEEQKALFAKKMQIDMDTLDGWLSGDVHMPTEDYLKACVIFETPPDEIMNAVPEGLYDKLTYDGDWLAAMVYALQEMVDDDKQQLYQALHTVERLAKKMAAAIERVNYYAGYRVDMVDAARKALREDRSDVE